jgi:hypothetical protein
MSEGPMTGRGLGPCGGGMRMGWGGCGLGWRRFFRSPKNQQQALDEEEKMLEEDLESVRSERTALKCQK